MKSFYVWLAVCLAVGMAACAAPPAHYSDHHGVWLERVKMAGW